MSYPLFFCVCVCVFFSLCKFVHNHYSLLSLLSSVKQTAQQMDCAYIPLPKKKSQLSEASVAPYHYQPEIVPDTNRLAPCLNDFRLRLPVCCYGQSCVVVLYIYDKVDFEQHLLIIIWIIYDIHTHFHI